MLTRLDIENFALIDKLSIEFSPSMNVLTGETGAGKSILIDAIRFVLGERMESERMPASGEFVRVEAIFEDLGERLKSFPPLAPFLQDDEEILILRREYHPQGRTRVWINNRAANASTLKEIGDQLLDIHGQYDHQLLLDASSHLDLVDRFGKWESLKKKYQTFYQEYASLLSRREELASLEEGREREMDLLKYQIDEIGQAHLKEGEEETLENERIKLANAEKLFEIVNRSLALLDEEETSVSSHLGKALRGLNELVRIDASLETMKTESEGLQLHLEEIIRTLRDYRESLSFEPDRLREVEERLHLIELLKRKYGGTVNKIWAFFGEAKSKYDQLAHKNLYEKEIDQKVGALLPELQSLAAELSQKRKKAGNVLKQLIEIELKDLGIAPAQFQCSIEEKAFGTEGRDQLEFLISLNLGEPLLPLRKIISAGEVSRVMLALKKALMKVDPIPTLIFDEIDANIGGRLGTVTGLKLKEIAKERQVLLITHLPQIASFADRHFKVTKVVRQGKTLTEYHQVEGEERIRELAQMMSGKRETEVSLKHAEEMLHQVTQIREKS